MLTQPIENPDREQRLDEVLASYLRAAHLGNAPEPQKLIDGNPELARELNEFFADQKCVDRLASPLRCIQRAVAPPEFGQSLGNYELLEEIAHGGMGVVYKARQKGLERIVALKMLRAGPLATEGERQRFRAEAEAFARLEHPNIVPIYEVGEEAGRLYFTMKYIAGGSLADHLGRYRAELREGARLLACIAEAVHYAHQRGFLHRDLKPANILLDSATPAGAVIPLVADFGLAKQMLAIPPEGGANLTQTGAILGTPSYMAPEQASGPFAAISTAVDVYSLGAIFYELLTGQPPFRADTLLETLRLARDQEPVRPGVLHPNLDSDLETICLKCLDKEPRRRYASAQALADDVHRYLEGRPIAARPVGRVEVCTRWCRRNPVLAALSASLIVSSIAGVALVTWQWQRAEENAARAEVHALLADGNARRAEELRHQAETDRARAEANFVKAHRAVSNFCTRVSDKDLRNVPGMQKVRKELLALALEYYQDFVKQHGEDPQLERELADAHVRVAEITDDVGARPDALAAYRDALVIYEKLVKQQPNDRALRRKLAGTWLNIGRLQKTMGEVKEGAVSQEKAIGLHRDLLRDQPDDADAMGGLANALHNLGLRYREMGRRGDALAMQNEALALRERLVVRLPRNDEIKDLLAGQYNAVAAIVGDEQGPETAKLVYEKGRIIREELVKRNPGVARYQRGLAETYHNLGVTDQRLGQPAAARDWYQKAFVLHQNLVRNNPTVSQYRRDLAGSHVNLGNGEERAGRHDKAIARFHQARQIQEKLVAENPRVPDYRLDLARTWFNIGASFGRLGTRVEACAAYEHSRELYAVLVREDADNLDYHSALAGTENNLGIIVAQQGDLENGRRLLLEAIAHQQRALERAPTNAGYRQALNSHFGSLGEIERAAGRCTEAVRVTLERRKLCAGNAAELYRIARDLALIAARIGKGKPEVNDADKAERERCSILAIEVLDQSIASGFRDGAKLRADKAFDLLRERADFLSLRQRIDAKPPSRSHDMQP